MQVPDKVLLQMLEHLFTVKLHKEVLNLDQ